MSFQGFYINAKILDKNDLNLKEVVLLCGLVSLSKKSGECFPSNEYLKRIVKVTTKTRVSQLVNGLVKKGYISTSQKDYGRRIISITSKTKMLTMAQSKENKPQQKTQQKPEVVTRREEASQAFSRLNEIKNMLGVAL